MGGLVVGNNIECYDVRSALAGVSWSDRRLKKDIQKIEKDKAYKLLDEIKPCTFIYKKDGGFRIYSAGNAERVSV